MKKVRSNYLVELAGALILMVSMIAIHNYLVATGVMVAAIFISSTIDRVRNKLGKHVFSRNKAGDFMRLRVKPSNPKTQAQMTSRGSFTQISRQWKTLTPFMRELWNKFAETNTVNNKLGYPIYISGFNWFMKKNIPLNYMGLEMILNPFEDNDELKQTFYKGCSAGYDANTGELNSFKINYKAGSESPNVYYEVFMSMKVSSGVTSYRSVSYSYLTKVASNTGGEIELIDAIRKKGVQWTNKDFEKAIYFKVRQVHAGSGYADAWWTVNFLMKSKN